MSDELKKLQEWKDRAKDYLQLYRHDLCDTLRCETILDEPKFVPEYVPILERFIEDIDNLLEE